MAWSAMSGWAPITCAAPGSASAWRRLVEYHVQAKRYLTFSQPDYYARLSEASRRTLAYQGGVMTA